MKKLQLSLTLVLCCLFTTNIVVSGQDSAEKKAVEMAVENENKAWKGKNFEEWKKHWVQTDYVSSTFSSSYYYNREMGWDSLKASTKKYMESEQTEMKIERKNMEIYVTGNSAVVTQKALVNADKAQFPFVAMDMERTLYMEKHNGSWKIAGEHTYDISSYEPNNHSVEMHINMAGYYFLYASKFDEALQVLTLNTELFPDAFNTWDSLAEAYMMKGDSEKAVKYYKKSLELNPKNKNATDKLAELAAK